MIYLNNYKVVFHWEYIFTTSLVHNYLRFIKDYSKGAQGLSVQLQQIASSQLFQFHRVSFRDSRAVVTSFVQDGTYPPRNFATLGPSGLRPPFTGTYIKNRSYSLFFILQHRADVRFYTYYCNFAKSCVFIKQSLLSFIFCI